jgi:hypothetical protein
MVNIDTIEAYFKENGFSSKTCKLSNWETITDTELFVSSFICILRHNPGKRSFFGYYLTLLKYYELENKKSGNPEITALRNLLLI